MRSIAVQVHEKLRTGQVTSHPSDLRLKLSIFDQSFFRFPEEINRVKMRFFMAFLKRKSYPSI
jgi:hypothetical protein